MQELCICEHGRTRPRGVGRDERPEQFYSDRHLLATCSRCGMGDPARVSIKTSENSFLKAETSRGKLDLIEMLGKLVNREGSSQEAVFF